MKIGIQGILGSFHDAAAASYFKDKKYEVMPFSGFRDLAKALSKKSLDYGVMAIENTIAGSILPNYALLNEYGLEVSGEVYSRIELSFLVNRGVSIDEITQVRSHPMALLQSADYLNNYQKIKIVESEDTADSAKAIKSEKLNHVAAIASKRAGELFDLDVLAENIETNRLNYTRFLIVNGKMNGNGQLKEKASLRLITGHKPGSLADVLTVFKDFKINLTKIQSMPIVGEPYNYAFNLDLVWEAYEDYKKALIEINSISSEVKILGEYTKGMMPITR